ncbi:hypothetical protein CJU89_0799 [Yarrowia sp. B02]|nr:hypothetical protein CJU89_0799 [Yarrowia sp. B02]
MQFSALLLAAAAGLASAQKFQLIAIHSGSDVQNVGINSDGTQLVVSNDVPVTTYEVKDRGLYANGKPVEFGQYAFIKETDGEASRDIIVNGEDHLYVPRWEFVACPNGKGGYVLADNSACAQGAIGINARAIWVNGTSASETAASSASVVTSQSTTQVTVTSCENDKCHKETAAPAPVTTANAVVSQIGDGQIQAPTTTPAQANGAAALGVSAAAAAVVGVAMLL